MVVEKMEVVFPSVHNKLKIAVAPMLRKSLLKYVEIPEKNKIISLHKEQ